MEAVLKWHQIFLQLRIWKRPRLWWLYAMYADCLPTWALWFRSLERETVRRYTEQWAVSSGNGNIKVYKAWTIAPRSAPSQPAQSTELVVCRLLHFMIKVYNISILQYWLEVQAVSEWSCINFWPKLAQSNVYFELSLLIHISIIRCIGYVDWWSARRRSIVCIL